MISINDKTLKDLEFNTILETIEAFCITELGKNKANAISPFKEKDSLMNSLLQTSEYVSSYFNNNAIPNHGFETITNDLKLLSIEGSLLDISSFRKFISISETSNTLIQFLKKFDDYYPKLNERASSVEYTKTIIQKIETVLDKYGEIKDNASPDLVAIRAKINVVRGKINQSFGMALSQYNSLGYLDDIRETIVENRRVLAVLAMYRRKVKGSILGNSKTGSILQG